MPLSLEEPIRENGEAIKIYGLVKRPTENLIYHPLWRFMPEEEVSRKEEYMKTTMGLWIDHRKAVIVSVSDKGEEISVIESKVEKQPGRFDGVRSTTPYESQKVPADGRQDIKFADQLNIYYDEVISVLRNAESILLFGPGEAKGELKKRLEDDHLAHLIQAVETVDQMTDPQIAAKVREYFK